jgi:hypothetical protein
MQLSYWELKIGFQMNYTVVGSGIVGLRCITLTRRFPMQDNCDRKGMLPQGASTKNAGFACFGSLSEIIEDLNSHTEESSTVNRKNDGGTSLLRRGGLEILLILNLSVVMSFFEWKQDSTYAIA